MRSQAYRQMIKGMMIISVMLLLGGCKKKEKEIESSVLTPIPTSAPVLTPTLAPTVTPEVKVDENMAKSLITGELVPKEQVNQRPYAMMFNNIDAANPQSGIGEADILYEALVEGGITRLMGIFDGIDENSEAAKRLGSIRSARHYYVKFAMEYDAIFVHYGQTTYAKKEIAKSGIDTVNGMYGPGANSFYRDKSIKAPHNAFINLSGIKKAIEAGDYRTEYKEDYKGHFTFNEEDTNLSGESADSVTLHYSKVITPVFHYDANKKVYLRNQYNGPHIDANTKEQLSFKNLIIQFVKEWNIDKNGYQTMDLAEAKGTGYYITNGKAVPITWKKDESKNFMKFYDASGKELSINPGKTYVGVFPDNRKTDVSMK